MAARVRHSVSGRNGVAALFAFHAISNIQNCPQLPLVQGLPGMRERRHRPHSVNPIMSGRLFSEFLKFDIMMQYIDALMRENDH